MRCPKCGKTTGHVADRYCPYCGCDIQSPNYYKKSFAQKKDS